MKKRHVFATPDLAAAKAVVRAARAQGIERRCITVEARSDIEVHRISDERKNVSMDFLPAALRGTVLGAGSGLLLALPLLLLAPSADVRYLAWTVAASLMAVLLCLFPRVGGRPGC